MATVTLNKTTLVMAAGEHAMLMASAACSCGSALAPTITWTSSDLGVATVAATGEVTAVGFGTATITASAEGKSTTATIQVQAQGTPVGPAGGTVMSTDGNVILEIPAGALDALTDITITPVADALLVTDPLYIRGTGYEVKPAGLQLHERARVRIRFDPARVPTGVRHEQLRIRERDRDQDQWRDCDHLRLQEHMVEAWTERFGQFAIVVDPNAGTVIGQLGGTVVSADGNVELEIPAGALDVETEIFITKVDDALFAADPLYVAGTAYEVTPAQLQLKQRARLRVRFDPAHVPAGVNHDRLRIRERDRDQDRWRDCDHLRLQLHVVESFVERLGLFAIVANAQSQAAVAKVSVSPGTFVFEEGDVVQMTADVLDAAGNVLDVSVTWSSDNTAVAIVDETGLVTAVAAGSATITAVAGGVPGKAPVNVTKKGPPPATITVAPASSSIVAGQTVQLTAVVRDSEGNVVDRSVTWSTSAAAVATVASDGLVTGVGAGTATITARLQNVTASATVSVSAAATSVVITPIGKEPLEIGATLQLMATALDASGQPLPGTILWKSSNIAIASVSASGLVTGVGRGTATITASLGLASDAVDVRVVGEPTEGGGNNLSWPVVFADGIGLTGQPAATDPGVRPTTAEGITVDITPFFWSGNVPTYNGYYEQQTFNTWRAEWIDGAGQPAYAAQIYWGDNITAHDWNAARPIRIEHALSATGVGTLTGYNMTELYGQGPDEMQGTDGTISQFIPLIYTVGPTIIVEKISGPGGTVTASVLSSPIGSEINVGGRVIYGFLLRLSDWTPPSGETHEGWYRITFRLADGANVSLQSVGNSSGTYLPVIVNERESMIEVHVNQ